MNIDQENLRKYSAIIGCDEVGRGPIAGPVNACAAKIDKKNIEIIEKLIDLKVTDSKKLSEKKRKLILSTLNINAEKIELDTVYKNSELGFEFSYCVTEHDHNDIDKMNILQASLSAMKNASEKLIEDKSIILIDGNKTFESRSSTEAIIKGDSKVVAIGLASIIAKEFRDEKMKRYDLQYPGFNLSQHAGYPTKQHRDAVKELGPSPIHRKSFKGVKEYL